MGYSEKAHQVEGGFESEGKKWVIVGIPIRTPLRKIRTKKIEKEVVLVLERSTHEQEEDEYCSTTTPTSEEAKIPEIISCPPAPRKRRPSSRCSHFNGTTVREFFTPPDLESVFIRHVERAK